MGRGKGKVGSKPNKANDVCIHCRKKGHWKRECPMLLSSANTFVIEVNMITNSASSVLDTGCGARICNDLQVLERSRKLSRDEVVLKLGDGKAVAAEAVGIVQLVVSDQVRIELKDCYYVPSMIKTIISILLLDNVGFEFMINKNYFYLMKNGSSHLLGKLYNGLYILQQHDLIMTSQNKRKMDNQQNAQIWYARLGHVSQNRIKRLVESKNLEIDDLDHLPACESCLKGKMTKKPFVGQSTVARGLVDLIHSDVYGPLNTQVRGGFSYFITSTDDHSRYGYVYLMRYKSEAFGRFKEFRLEVENQTDSKIKPFGRTEMSMMSFTDLPLSFCGYALETTIKLLNRAPSKTVAQTPYQIWHGKPASYKYLRVWGSPAYVKKLVGDKLYSRSSLCRFVGYPKKTVGYYFYDLSEQKVFVSRNAVFLEKGFLADTRREELLREESSLTGQLDNDPKTYGEAMSDIDSEKCFEAMKSEMDSMSLNKVWTLVDPPKGVKPVGCKWVYKCKHGADGEVTTFKARLVAKGCTQRPGVNFEETYSPVAMAKSIRIMLAIAAWLAMKYGRWM
ncbi:UNVERIFIED_CONTAM: hypothetical protein Sradi_6981600 [Sesamum radiatum]|uniref:CCHC-type domain-containing protein n=1 Tax=Sesamum radiatum TaxID=300843 RepID=A0AAW2JE48_SESRA